MGYSTEWYDKYRLHLEEPRVRDRHDRMFEFFNNFYKFGGRNQFPRRNVVDFGCATQEYYKYGQRQSYFGIDLNDVENNDLTYVADYTKVKLTEICPFKPNTFVSIFSTEIIMPATEKYDFYERLFTENDSLEVGMVAGFYYHDYRNSAFVREDSVNYNDTVYQTTENQLHFQSKLFAEYRTYVHAPSELFGENITEVWKIFKRINYA